MGPRQNDVFRFVSVHGPESTFTAEPTRDVPDSAVVRALRAVEVDPEQPDATIRALIEDVATESYEDLTRSSVIAAAATAIHDSGSVAFPDLKNLRLQVKGEDGEVKPIGPRVMDLATTWQFRHEYRQITDAWLKERLIGDDDSVVLRFEDLLRIAHLILTFRRDPVSLAEPGAVPRLLTAQIVLPHGWTSAGRREQDLRTRQRAKLAAGAATRADARDAALAIAETRYKDLAHRREVMEGIQAKAQQVYVKWKRDTLADATDAGAVEATPRRALSERLRNRRASDRAGSRQRRVGRLQPKLDDGFYTALDRTLTAEERHYHALAIGGFKPETLPAHDEKMAPERWLDEANRICRQIKLWERNAASELPDAPASAPSNERPLVRSIGWGALVVARERLIGYEANEIAHIENLMPGEEKLREHERDRKVEEVIERDTLQETESERDLQTTDRFELQSQAQATIQEEYSIQAGLNTSGKYGLTQVDTSLQAGLQQSKSEARSSSQAFAREVVSKAVERTFERVRELRRQTITEQVRELNRHVLANKAASGTTAADVSGIYLWAEKLLEVQLRHYGTRMLVEFHIPEPAVSLLQAEGTAGPGPRKPAAFRLAPSDVMPENYLCLASTYGARDVAPPPPARIRVGYAWASTPDEEAESWGQDARADMIAIPAGYRPIDMTALVSAHPVPEDPDENWPERPDVFMAIAGEVVIDLEGFDYGESGQATAGEPNVDGPAEIDFDPPLRWPGGVPVVIRAAGHFDKTLVAEATVRCVRTREALDEWRLRTWEQLRTAHTALMQTYRNELEEQRLSTFGEVPLQRPEAENRRIEAEELRKWAIKAMRLKPFTFEAVVTESDGLQEVDALDADLVATVASFFEESFEWSQASYFLYPYYWARRETWRLRADMDADDPRHAAFLRAGAARFIVPVTPGYEERVVHYLESQEDELDRLAGPPADYAPDDPSLTDLWREILVDRRPELALGSGTLAVTANRDTVTINADSSWTATARDLGRELYIDGDQYSVKSVTDGETFVLDRDYAGATNPVAIYATGSVPYGPPWVARVPTSLVVLDGTRPNLAALHA